MWIFFYKHENFFFAMSFGMGEYRVNTHDKWDVIITSPSPHHSPIPSRYIFYFSMLLLREYWMTDRGPGFLGVRMIWLLAQLPTISRHQVILSFSVFMCVSGRAFWRKWWRGRGRSQSIRRKAWSSLNHSILSAPSKHSANKSTTKFILHPSLNFSGKMLFLIFGILQSLSPFNI